MDWSNDIAAEKSVIENLKDAGCSDDEIDQIIQCYRKGEIRSVSKLLMECRRKQVASMHRSQIYIDRLDYLSFQLDHRKDH